MRVHTLGLAVYIHFTDVRVYDQTRSTSLSRTHWEHNATTFDAWRQRWLVSRCMLRVASLRLQVHRCSCWLCSDVTSAQRTCKRGAHGEHRACGNRESRIV